MILVVKAHASVISWAGMRGDRLATVVFRRGATTSQPGHEPEIPISALRTSHMLRGARNVFGAPVLSRKAWRTELSSSHQNVPARCS